MTDLVSVIIPNYNHAQFLKQRFDSVVNQSYENIEVIILDDASTDNSKILIEEFKTHAKISTVIYNNINSGSAFAQWEKGIAAAKGKYIWIAESDDFCENNFLETLMPHFQKQENVGLVYSRSNNVDENGKIHRVFWPDGLDSEKWTKDYFNKGVNEIQTALKYRNTIPNASACVFEKQVFDFTKIKTMFFAGDWLFWTNLLENKNISFSCQELNHFRFHDKTTRNDRDPNKKIKKYREYMYTLQYIYKMTNSKLDFERKHFWIYYDFMKQDISLSFIFQHLRPFFKPYAKFRYKLLKHNFRTNILKK